MQSSQPASEQRPSWATVPAGMLTEPGVDRSSAYKCSRCGQPKKQHVCTAPNTMSSSEQAKLRKEQSTQGEHAQASGELRSAWTKIEDEIILSSVLAYGPKWTDIAARLPGRTEHAARNRYHRLSSALARDEANGAAS